MKKLTAKDVLADLASKNISVRVASPKNIPEEAPSSYKDVMRVVETCEAVGISRKVLRLEPVCVIKG